MNKSVSDEVKAAEAEERKAARAFEALEHEARQVRGELARIEDVEELRADDLVAKENLKRKLTRLGRQSKEAAASITAASARLKMARTAAQKAACDELAARVKAEGEEIARYVREVVTPKLAELLSAHVARAREATSLANQVRIAEGRSGLELLNAGVSTLWSGIDPEKPWAGIAEALERSRFFEAEAQRLDEEARARRARPDPRFGTLLPGPRLGDPHPIDETTQGVQP